MNYVPSVRAGASCLQGNLRLHSADATHHVHLHLQPRGNRPSRGLRTSRVSEASKSDEKRRAEDRQDIVMSVLQASATRRDAHTYLKKYAPQPDSLEARQTKPPTTESHPYTWSSTVPARAVSENPQFVQGNRTEAAIKPGNLPNLAIVKLRAPQALEDEELRGMAKTLSQLRKLGLISVVVLDAGHENSKDTYIQQAHRLQHALDENGPPGARVADYVFAAKAQQDVGFLPSSVEVRQPQSITGAIESEEIVIVTPMALSSALDSVTVIDPDDALIALTKYFSGLQELQQKTTGDVLQSTTGGTRTASIERIIILDPVGAIPIPQQLGASHRFINLEQEYDQIILSLKSGLADEKRSVHVQNLKLLRDILALLPSTSTALISSPSVAATKPPESLTRVATRNKLNPLIHNLLTDKPVFSSSLPLERVRPEKNAPECLGNHVATVVKRGMPLTIYPDPAKTPWTSPSPGGSRLRLTDKCIDLPRLQHLIEDSFDRKLDLDHYLRRVNDNLAGIIIAGEYEGGAILTWEKPSHLSNEEAYTSGRLVPYLDKFAVLKSRQGSGGVADAVFNAMVRTCLPEGVSWRSRKDNPVNKWYFERSLGTRKLPDTNWTMFWTTPLAIDNPALGDYEDVCRSVEPSWVDTTRAAD
ncbi:amino-acid N-acetyltransferase [Plectosphaerella plurivora]|uniref:Amino-acid acetyltransferase, mitochondrial n=1 Tax=Plectosphaerella plurivora TaxID=936078 RepID=A0A9P8VD28_9PEZI|nr:amino-acid N-acetyltransferase [Plectosphaerella plurivora]